MRSALAVQKQWALPTSMRRSKYLVEGQIVEKVARELGVWLSCLIAAALAAGLSLSAGGGRLAHAATINVNSTADNLTAGDGNCTLREAIRNANSNSDTTSGDCTAGSGADTIILPAGTYTLSIPGANEDAAATGDLDITGTLTITGDGAATTVIEACTVDQKIAACPGGSGIVDRVLDIQFGANVTITGVMIRHGNDSGGGIRNQGTLDLTDSVVTDNTTAGQGGAPAIVGHGHPEKHDCRRELRHERYGISSRLLGDGDLAGLQPDREYQRLHYRRRHDRQHHRGEPWARTPGRQRGSDLDPCPPHRQSRH